jgi:hypothetical protein
MKKTIILTACFTAFTVLNSSAKIWRVNNAGLPADFTSIQAAHNDADVLAGDTLHIEPSWVSYGALVSTKKLIILGPGYFLDLNTNQQANPATASITSFTLNAGSSGTVISGLTITGENNYINTGNVTISRNNIANAIFLSRDYSYSNVLISGNLCSGYIGDSGSGASLLITNVLIFNNLLYYILLPVQFSGVISNNVISHYNNSISNFTIKNNIITSTTNYNIFNGSFNTISNNICASPSGLPGNNGNQNNVSMATVFIGATGNSTDGQYQLANGSPAIGAGLNGEDCGMYGGSTPYHLSGLPEIPSVYFLSAPSNSNGNTLPVTISVKTNN